MEETPLPRWKLREGNCYFVIYMDIWHDLTSTILTPHIKCFNIQNHNWPKHSYRHIITQTPISGWGSKQSQKDHWTRWGVKHNSWSTPTILYKYSPALKHGLAGKWSISWLLTVGVFQRKHHVRRHQRVYIYIHIHIHIYIYIHTYIYIPFLQQPIKNNWSYHIIPTNILNNVNSGLINTPPHKVRWTL